MLWSGAQPLRRQLFLGIFLLLVPVLAAAIWSAWSTFRERAVELGDQASLVAVTSSAYVEREVRELDRVAEAVGNDVALERDGIATEDLLTRIALGRSLIRGVRLVGSDGAEISRAQLARDVSDSDVAWAADTMRANERVIGSIRSSGSPPVHYIVIAYPVHGADGQTTGALGFFIDLAGMREAFGSVALPQGSVVTITDARGEVLARSLDGERFVGRKMGEPIWSGPPLPPEERVSMVDGVRRMYAVSPLVRVPWVVTVGLPMSVALTRSQSLWVRNLGIMAAGLLGWFAIAVIMSRRLVRSLSHLAGDAQRIASGDFAPVEPKPMPTREFRELQSAFEQMLRRFNDTRAELDRHLTAERRVRQELESLERQVIRQERLAAVGQLVSGVAHEINNPLQAILGFSELLQMQADVPDPVKHDLKLIQKESARACGIIRNLALFAQQQPGEPSPVRLTDVINAVVELRQRRLESEDIEVRVEDKTSRAVSAVLTELQQVTLNFVVNAEQSILSSGRLPGRITIRTLDRNDHVVLEVEDTGPGIPSGNEAKLFQPFFTTKPVGQGTGLGLSISYGIIDSLGGRIGYRKAVAGGAVFYFELPAAPAEPA